MNTGLHRFFVPPSILGGERVALSGEQAHQMSRVLRLKVGDRVVLLDGAGQEYRVKLDDVRSAAVAGAVETVRASRPEPGLHLTLYQALVPRDRFETVLQKGTEVGISRFVPVWCERSIVPRGDQLDERRLERWRRIVTEAAEQCERGRVPEIAAPVRFGRALEEVAGRPALLAWERETERSLRDGLRAALGEYASPSTVVTSTSASTMTDAMRELSVMGAPHQPPGAPNCSTSSATRALGLLIGPEGGFSATEIDAAREAGVITVSLGPRIFRTETAGPVLAALALYEAGDLAPHLPRAGLPLPDRTSR